MFHWLNKQTVQSSDGFIVESTGRFTMAYLEKGRRMTIEVEHGMLEGTAPCTNYLREAFLQWDGETTVLPTVEQERIAKNFSDALRFQGLIPLPSSGSAQ